MVIKARATIPDGRVANPVQPSPMEERAQSIDVAVTTLVYVEYGVMG
jgi:hypothetical protein